jgi:predicted RNA-binding protein associated with RNAse of E/G family
MIEVGLLDMLLEAGLISKDEYNKAVEALYKNIA